MQAPYKWDDVGSWLALERMNPQDAHGNTVLANNQRTDVLNMAPAQMMTVDMVPDNPGTWLYHCHVSDHMHAGMSALYQVDP